MPDNNINTPKVKAEKVEKVFNPDALANVYTKLLALRREVSDLRLTQGGKNTYSKYSYFELADFEPKVIPLFEKYGLLPIVDYTPTVATLTMVNVTNPQETIVFHSPMPDLISSMQKGNTLMQTQGSLETYSRRYLYLTALELVQADTEEKDAELMQRAAGSAKGIGGSSQDSSLPYNQSDVDILVTAIGSYLTAMQKKDGNLQKFVDYKTNVLNNPDFACQKATPADYQTLKSIQKFLLDSGYSAL